MHITITATNQLTTVHGIQVRVWDGITERGIPCKVFVPLIAVHKAEDSAQFDAELAALPPGRAMSMRDIL